MAEAEKKKIADLTFNINDAIKNLDEIDKKLSSIAKTSEIYSQSISNNFKKINLGELTNTNEIEKKLNKANTLSKSKADALAVQLTKIEAKKQANIALEQEKGEQKRQTLAYKTALKQEEYNNRVLSSTKTMYDKIAGYAETYILYQGFNILKNSIKDVIDEMVNLESEMVQIDRVLNENSLNIDNYRDKLLDLAYNYGNSMDNVTDVALRLAQAGFSSSETLALTEKTLLALNTAELNATQATDDMVAVMAQWGYMTGNVADETENYANIIDKVNKLADNFPTTSADLMDALKKVSSAFNLAGASIDETLATIVAAEKASQRGGKAIGTALSNITQQLKDEGRLTIAESLGLDFYTDETKKEFKDIMDIFQEMAEKMQALKDAGKENTVEMQNLLSIFTVFRRNVGASLLGEMSGEDSTYLNALNQSLTATGYSLQENEKYLKTTKAAQERFNAELLKLKTEVWDNGTEGVYRDILEKSSSFIEFVTKIVKELGVLPTTIGLVTTAITAAKSKINVADMVSLTKKIKDINLQIKSTGEAIKIEDSILEGTSTNFKNYVTNVGKGEVSLKGYAAAQTKATTTTVALTAASVALNAILSMGIGLALTAIVSAIDKWVHAQENAIKKNNELKEQARENAQKYQEEAKSIKELREEYENLAKKNNRTSEEDERIYELQTQINSLIKDNGKQVNLVTEETKKNGEVVKSINEKYDEQLQIIKEIEREKAKQAAKELEDAARRAKLDADNFKVSKEGYQMSAVKKQLKDVGMGESANKLLKNGFQINSTVYVLEKMKQALEESEKSGKSYAEALRFVEDNLKSAKEKQNELNEATEEYDEKLKEIYDNSGLLTDYKTALKAINDTYGDNKNIKSYLTELNNATKSFEDGSISSVEYYDILKSKIKSLDKDIENNAAKITEQVGITDKSIAEFIESGGKLTESQKQLIQENGKELEAYQAIFAETTRLLATQIEDLQYSFEDNEITFAQYSESLAETNENLLELYATENDLELNTKGVWEGADEGATKYANSIQESIDKTRSFIEVLGTLGEYYDYIAENSDIAGNAMFEAADVADSRYQQLAINFGNDLANMRVANEEAWRNITKTVFESAGQNATEIANVDNYVTNALSTNYQNMNDLLNETAKQSQQAASDLATKTGQLISKLGETIENFDYELNFDTTGGIEPGGNLLDLAMGKKFKPTSDLKLTISGSAKGSTADLGQALVDWGNAFNNWNSTNTSYKSLLQTINPYVSSNKIGSPTTPTNNPIDTPKGSGGSSYSRDTEEENKYKNNLSIFENYVSEKERLEQRWVNKQKDLGQLSNKDYLYIIQQRINRYKEYINQVNKMTWLSEEDRLKLLKQYQEEIEDLQVDYLQYLKDNLEEQIDDLEKANKEKIQLIEDEADARINALKKVKDETSRLRDEEDYDKQRQEILEEISYWEQRTGREAAESLQEAKDSLAELDEEWRQQLEDWSIEDQIQAIEDERDAEIKAIEDSQEAQIKALQEAYDARVKLYAETGQIIYDQSIIESSNLYNAYKNNFVNPIMSDLDEIQKKIADTTKPAQTESAANQYESYTIQRGDTMYGIAKRYGTTIQKIMEANPYVTNANRIYAGKTLQIPKFHEGGIVGGNQEAYALLKPNEVILKPEWAESLNRMMKYFDNITLGNNVSSSNIEVAGDLVKIEVGSVRNQGDIDAIGKKVEKILKDKFNIKK